MSDIQVMVLLGMFFLYGLGTFYFFWATTKGAPYYPSNKKAIATILELLPKDKSKRIVELGAGDGRIAFAMAKAGYKVTAIEFNSFLSLLMRLIKLIKRIDNIEIKNKNFFAEDLNQYDIYVGYLFPEIMKKLDALIFTQANKGKVVISNTFTIKGRDYDQLKDKIYVYKVQ